MLSRLGICTFQPGVDRASQVDLGYVSAIGWQLTEADFPLRTGPRFHRALDTPIESSSGGTVKKPIGMAWLTLPDDLVLAKKGKTKMDDTVAHTQKIRQQLESVV